MTGILDNRKIAKLVISTDGKNYEKINPETLATIVEDSNLTEGSLPKSVQDHIDNKEVHLTKQDVTDLTRDALRPNNINAGKNIIIDKEEGTNNLTISTVEFKSDKFITGDDIIPEDKTITITPIADSKQINIRANIPDVSKFTKQKNIKAGSNVSIKYDELSNDVIISSDGGEENIYNPGVGIRIDNKTKTITNTMPDKIVNIASGHNVTVEGQYPDFKISSSDNVSINEWRPDTYYELNDICVYKNSLFKCVKAHTSSTAFDSHNWKLLAGSSVEKQVFNIELSTDRIVLDKEVPNKDVLFINVGGIWQQSINYNLEPDNRTIVFIKPLPVDVIVEVLIMGNIVLDTYENQVTIKDWKENTSYSLGNIVIYDKCLFKCVETHVSLTDFDKNKWELLSGFTKESFFFETTEETSSIVLPKIVYKETDILVNVGNTLLQSNNYTLSNDMKTISFKEPIESGAIIEVVIFGNAVVQHNSIPNPENPDMMLISNEAGNGYNAIDLTKVKELLGIKTLTQLQGNSDKFVTVNNDETDYNFVSANKLSSYVKLRNIVNGFYTTIKYGTKEPEYAGIVNDANDMLEFNKGSAVDKLGGKIIDIEEKLIKNPNMPYLYGNKQGCMVGFVTDAWEQPVMTSNIAPVGTVVATEEQVDREAYRALDGMHDKGNGWLANNTTAMWEYKLPYSIKLNSIDFYNQFSTANNRSKDVDVWVDNANNVVASFTAVNADYGHSHVDLAKPVITKSVGLTIKNSYGTAVGMKEFKINAEHISNVGANATYNIYAISNEDGSLNDIAISLYNEQEFYNNLPSNFTRYCLIGEVKTDGKWHFYDAYPNKEIKDTFINGEIAGVLDNNILKTVVMNNETKHHETIKEQWGETVVKNKTITFPQAYKKLFYVMANGVKVLTKTNTGFTVEASDGTVISWVAKGY